jgi:hypothetical protein
MAAPPALPDDLVEEEILLRLPPDDPSCILRASVVCKAWRSAISHPRFRRRLHELHPTPPVLGFLHNWDNHHIPRFVPTTASSFSLAAPDCRSWRALDCRHGRALFLSEDQGPGGLLVWVPITGAHQRVPVPAVFESEGEDAMNPNVAVLCAAGNMCDHVDCLGGGPFRVVFVFAVEFVISACVYSSETGTWGEPTLLHRQVANYTQYSSVLVGNSMVYFLSDGEQIQEYDLARRSLTLFNAPDDSFEEKFNIMLAENGELVVSEYLDQRLKLWSRESSGGTGARWVVSRVIYLENLLPTGALVGSVDVLGFAEGANAIFVTTVAGLFMIELQSGRVRKVCDDHGFCNLIPVVGFYTPRSRLRALGGQHNAPLPPWNPAKEEALKFAHELFDKGCKAMQERNFANASYCFNRALKIRLGSYCQTPFLLPNRL